MYNNKDNMTTIMTAVLVRTFPCEDLSPSSSPSHQLGECSPIPSVPFYSAYSFVSIIGLLIFLYSKGPFNQEVQTPCGPRLKFYC